MEETYRIRLCVITLSECITYMTHSLNGNDSLNRQVGPIALALFIILVSNESQRQRLVS